MAQYIHVDELSTATTTQNSFILKSWSPSAIVKDKRN